MQYHGATYAADVWDTYWFEKNLQGDIVAVYDTNGTKLTYYKYDAWGNTTVTYSNSGASTTATKNPFRYRGYYYDSDLGLYYLQTRYYDAKIGRFISPDTESVITATPDALTDKNLYAYCDNNPVMRVDEDGEYWQLIKCILGAAINVTISYISSKVTGKEYTWEDAANDAIIGAFSTISKTTSIISGLFNGIKTGVDNYKNGASIGEAFASGTLSAVLNIASIGNLANLGNSASEIIATATADLVFGTGYSLVSAAFNKLVTQSKKPREGISETSIFKTKIARRTR